MSTEHQTGYEFEGSGGVATAERGVDVDIEGLGSGSWDDDGQLGDHDADASGGEIGDRQADTAFGEANPEKPLPSLLDDDFPDLTLGANNSPAAPEDAPDEPISYAQKYVLRDDKLYPFEANQDDGTKSDVDMSHGMSDEAIENLQAAIAVAVDGGVGTTQMLGLEGHTDTTQTYIVSSYEVVGVTAQGEKIINITGTFESRDILKPDEQPSDEADDGGDGANVAAEAGAGAGVEAAAGVADSDPALEDATEAALAADLGLPPSEANPDVTAGPGQYDDSGYDDGGDWVGYEAPVLAPTLAMPASPQLTSSAIPPQASSRVAAGLAVGAGMEADPAPSPSGAPKPTLGPQLQAAGAIRAGEPSPSLLTTSEPSPPLVDQLPTVMKTERLAPQTEAFASVQSATRGANLSPEAAPKEPAAMAVAPSPEGASKVSQPSTSARYAPSGHGEAAGGTSIDEGYGDSDGYDFEEPVVDAVIDTAIATTPIVTGGGGLAASVNMPRAATVAPAKSRAQATEPNSATFGRPEQAMAVAVSETQVRAERAVAVDAVVPAVLFEPQVLPSMAQPATLRVEAGWLKAEERQEPKAPVAVQKEVGLRAPIEKTIKALDNQRAREVAPPIVRAQERVIQVAAPDLRKPQEIQFAALSSPDSSRAGMVEAPVLTLDRERRADATPEAAVAVATEPFVMATEDTLMSEAVVPAVQDSAPTIEIPLADSLSAHMPERLTATTKQAAIPEKAGTMEQGVDAKIATVQTESAVETADAETLDEAHTEAATQPITARQETVARTFIERVVTVADTQQLREVAPAVHFASESTEKPVVGMIKNLQTFAERVEPLPVLTSSEPSQATSEAHRQQTPPASEHQAAEPVATERDAIAVIEATNPQSTTEEPPIALRDEAQESAMDRRGRTRTAPRPLIQMTAPIWTTPAAELVASSNARWHEDFTVAPASIEPNLSERNLWPLNATGANDASIHNYDEDELEITFETSQPAIRARRAHKTRVATV